MIKIRIKKNGIDLSEIFINGHANYACYGKDVVCAAVSATVLTSLNSIMALDDSVILVEQEDDCMIIKVQKFERTSQVLLSTMLSCLKEIEKTYSKNLKIYD